MKSSTLQQTKVTFLPYITTPRSVGPIAAQSKPFTGALSLPAASKRRFHRNRSKSSMEAFEKCFEASPNLVSKSYIQAQLEHLHSKLSGSAVFNESFSGELVDLKQYLAELRNMGAKQVE